MENNCITLNEDVLKQVTNTSYTELACCDVKCSNPIAWTVTEADLESSINQKIKEITELIDRAAKERKLNEQWFIDSMDELNRQSVRY